MPPLSPITTIRPKSILGSAVLFLSTTAQAGGLDKAKTILESFQDEILELVPIIAVIALVLLAIGYATNFVEKDTFIRWAVGLIIAGSASLLTSTFFTN